jgi:hypothetical protein
MAGADAKPVSSFTERFRTGSPGKIMIPRFYLDEEVEVYLEDKQTTL